MDSNGRAKALEAVKTISATGGTALCAGLLLGLDLMRERKVNSNAVASVMLFTDGDANVGYSTARDIIQATIDPEFAKNDGSSQNEQQQLNNYIPQQYQQLPDLQDQQQQQQPQQQQPQLGFFSKTIFKKQYQQFANSTNTYSTNTSTSTSTTWCSITR